MVCRINPVGTGGKANNPDEWGQFANSNQHKLTNSTSEQSLDMLNEPILIKSKWTAKDLDGKTVEFQIWEKSEDGQLIPIRGNGIFRAIDCPNDLIRIEIVFTQTTPFGSEDEIFYCPQPSANFIKRQAPGSQFDFSLFEF
jgi:hypothetical protein